MLKRHKKSGLMSNLFNGRWRVEMTKQTIPTHKEREKRKKKEKLLMLPPTRIMIFNTTPPYALCRSLEHDSMNRKAPRIRSSRGVGL